MPVLVSHDTERERLTFPTCGAVQEITAELMGAGVGHVKGVGVGVGVGVVRGGVGVEIGMIGELIGIMGELIGMMGGQSARDVTVEPSGHVKEGGI